MLGNNISFGKLYLGTPENKNAAKYAVSEFVQGDEKLVTSFSTLCSIMNEKSGKDAIVLDMHKNNEDDIFFNLKSSTTHKTRGSEWCSTDYTIFHNRINANASKESKSNFLNMLYKEFKTNIETGRFFLDNLSKNYSPKNPKSPLTFNISGVQLENIIRLTLCDKQTSDELAKSIKDIEQSLQKSGNSGHISTRYKGNSILSLSLHCNNGKRFSVDIDIRGNSEDKCKLLKKFTSDIQTRLKNKTQLKVDALFDMYS